MSRPVGAILLWCCWRAVSHDGHRSPIRKVDVMPERSSYVEGTPSWVDLTTTDPEAAKGFYSSVLGWDFSDVPTDQGGQYTMASKSSKSVAGVMQQPPQQAEQGMPPMWTTYITVDDIETCLLYTSPSPRDKRQSRMPSSA